MSRESVWDPSIYGRYADHRSRPFFELVGRVAATSPREVVDLGCGSGELTATLAERWPDAHVVGVDSSAEMLALSPTGVVDFVQGDIATWRPPSPVDVLVSNAAFQWVPGHLELLPSLLSCVAPDGWLAFQVPGNFDAPSHTLLASLRQSPRWRDLVGGGAVRAGSHSAAEYLSALTELGCTVDAWETTYLQVLSGEDPVLEWTRGTALRPVLSALNEEQAAEFLAEYGELLRSAYPRQSFGMEPYGSASLRTDSNGSASLRTDSNGSASLRTEPNGSASLRTEPNGSASLRTVFPFRRIFVVAQTARA